MHRGGKAHLLRRARTVELRASRTMLISKISLDRLVTETINFLGHQPMFR